MITDAFNKPMTINEATAIVSEAMFSDDKIFEDYKKDFAEWLEKGEKLHVICGG